MPQPNMEELYSRILNLPSELRRMIYDRAGIVVGTGLSLHTLTSPPDFFDKLTGAIRDEILDIYFGENVFIGGNAVGLGVVLQKANPEWLRRIRKLRLRHQIWCCDSMMTSKLYLDPAIFAICPNHDCMERHMEGWYCADIASIRGYPWYSVVIEAGIQDDPLEGEVVGALEEHLAIRRRVTADGFGAFDSFADLTKVFRDTINSVYGPFVAMER